MCLLSSRYLDRLTRQQRVAILFNIPSPLAAGLDVTNLKIFRTTPLLSEPPIFTAVNRVCFIGNYALYPFG